MYFEFEREFNSLAHPILNPVGHESRFWGKGRKHLRRMLDAIERLSSEGDFTKHDLRNASGAAMPAVYDFLAKLIDYEKIDYVCGKELRPNARDVCPAEARYRLKPGADLSRFREIANAYEHAKAKPH